MDFLFLLLYRLPVEYGGTGKLGLKTIKDLYTPDNIWILENGRPESWGPSPFPVDSRRE